MKRWDLLCQTAAPEGIDKARTHSGHLVIRTNGPPEKRTNSLPKSSVLLNQPAWLGLGLAFADGLALAVTLALTISLPHAAAVRVFLYYYFAKSYTDICTVMIGLHTRLDSNSLTCNNTSTK